MALLEVKNISKKFGGLSVLKDISFNVEQGSIVGLIGPNGAGKSTIFNIISGFIRPDSGRILFRNKDITKLRPHEITRLSISRTFQSVRPFMDYTVEENVKVGALFGRGYGRTVEDRTNYAISLTGLESKRTEKVSSLPIQQRKLVEVARALASSPELILLDEPMAGFNNREIEHFSNIIKQIREKGTTVLLVEHVMKAIMGLSDKVIVLNAGTKIAEGKPEEVTKNEQVIAAYLGDKYAGT